MITINNRDDANKYYNTINGLIDNYIKSHKIKPSELYKYIKRNIDSFINQNKLSDIKGIKRIINDVLEHKRNMELDNILKFEKFKLLKENVIEIGDATIEHEKVLSDYYKTSIGHVDLIDSDVHLYSINDFGKKVKSIIYSDIELDIIKSNIIDSFVLECEKKKLLFNKLDGITTGIDINFYLTEIFDKEKFKDKISDSLTNDNIITLIGNIIKKDSDNKLNTDNIKYIKDFKGYHIWEIYAAS
jgi:hypothetical protein